MQPAAPTAAAVKVGQAPTDGSAAADSIADSVGDSAADPGANAGGDQVASANSDADAHSTADGDTAASDGAASSDGDAQCKPFVPATVNPPGGPAKVKLGQDCPMGCNLTYCADKTSDYCDTKICVWDGPMNAAYCSMPCNNDCPVGYACRKADDTGEKFCFYDVEKFVPDLGQPCKGTDCSPDYDTNCATVSSDCLSGVCAATAAPKSNWRCAAPCSPKTGCPCGFHCGHPDKGWTGYFCIEDGTECKNDADCEKKSWDFCHIDQCVYGICHFKNTNDVPYDPKAKCKAPDNCTLTYCDSIKSQCNYQPKNCDDNKACTADTCDPGKGCVNTPMASCCGDGNCSSGETTQGCPTDCAPGNNTCAYRCGKAFAGGCSCENKCATDPAGCCADYQAACGGNPGNSCVGNCGSVSSNCNCSTNCAKNSAGCCADYVGACIAPKPKCEPADECFGQCATATPFGAVCKCNVIDTIAAMTLPDCISRAYCCP